MLRVPLQLLFLIWLNQLTYAWAQNKENKTDKLKKRIDEIFGAFDEDKFPVTDAGLDQCICVRHYLCNSSTVNSNGEGIINIRNNENNCESYLDTCCSRKDISANKVLPPLRSFRHGCGYRNPKGVAFQTTGDENGEAKFGEFPWMVAILKEEIVNFTVWKIYQCGGSLISPRVVLTAAHCVNNRENVYIIRAGEWDTQTTNEILNNQERKIKSIVVHPDYYRAALYNDIALIFLESQFTLDQHIDVACLPQQEASTASGTSCWASGWGKDQFGAKSQYQTILKKLELPFVNRNSCQSSLRTTRLGKYFLLHDSFVCAGGKPGVDTCEGDGGSPLVCPISGNKDRYQQIGIVSWGIGCGKNGVPGVYVNVALFRNWIDNELMKYNLDTSQYQY
ncbi:serine protease-related [Holotrichia oblita]|uniref:Serine protease-related n=1 Tax=Holotrichia oblita TaxID=644536 RepID=A0ACB9SU11_HOLOL|nr:serine protease-related [Holotrichia oblita]